MKIAQAHALVTGGSRGLGEQIARRLAQRGATVTVSARSVNALSTLADEIDGHALEADLAEPDSRRDLIARAAEAAGKPVTILVNNAGIDLAGYFPDMSEEQVRQLIAVNVTAPAELCRQAIPEMLRAGGGSLVMVSSMAAAGTFPGLALYSATKSAITHLSAGLRADLKGLPIAITQVQTGLITPTAMADSVRSYPPTDASFTRFQRILPAVDVNALAEDIVRDGIEKGRRHVRRPRHSQSAALIQEFPRRITELLLARVPPRVG